MRILRAEGPGIVRVGGADAGDPAVEIRGALVDDVVVVLEHAADAEIPEGQVEAGLVEILLVAIRARRLLDMTLERCARAGGQAPVLAFVRIGAVERDIVARLAIRVGRHAEMRADAVAVTLVAAIRRV